MDYNQIKDYLGKFKDLLFSKEEIYRIISRAIENNVGIKIENKNIKIKTPNVYIKASPLVRSEIMMKKDKIISDINKISPESNIKDIK